VERRVEGVHVVVAGEGREGFFPAFVLRAVAGPAVPAVPVPRRDGVPEPFARALPERRARFVRVVNGPRGGDRPDVIKQQLRVDLHIVNQRRARVDRRNRVGGAARSFAVAPGFSPLQTGGLAVWGGVVRQESFDDPVAEHPAFAGHHPAVRRRARAQLFVQQTVEVHGAALDEPHRGLVPFHHLHHVRHLVDRGRADARVVVV